MQMCELKTTMGSISMDKFYMQFLWLCTCLLGYPVDTEGNQSEMHQLSCSYRVVAVLFPGNAAFD